MFVLAGIARADVKLANLFTAHAVLQQGGPVPVFGTAAAGEVVTVTIAGKSASATANEKGKWQAQLPALPAGGPYELVVKGKNELKVPDVMVGEVWIASGQSNMEWPLGNGSATAQEIASANYPKFRMFTVTKSVTSKPAADVGGEWRVCQPATASAFSAVAYYFGKELHNTLKVPVGIIHTSFGNTPAEAWTQLAALQADPELKPIVDRSELALEAYPKQLDDWKQASENAEKEGTPIPPPPKDPRSDSWRPGGVYNAMVAPIVPYEVRGVIWYQGESNVNRAFQYRKLLPTMIKTWRDAWAKSDPAAMPFYIVQLANFTPPPAEPGESDWAELREAQTLTVKMPGNALACTIDIGDANDIHPRNKEDVGHRLALIALAKTYGKSDVAYAGPEFDSMAIEGREIRVTFKNADGLSTRDGGAVKGFAVAGADRAWHWADGKIEGSSVVVHSDKVPKPIAVRYAWAHNPPTNLYNRAGLPAEPFRTDDWKPVTADAR
jgi:sialate O-acetylesterase